MNKLAKKFEDKGGVFTVVGGVLRSNAVAVVLRTALFEIGIGLANQEIFNNPKAFMISLVVSLSLALLATYAGPGFAAADGRTPDADDIYIFVSSFMAGRLVDQFRLNTGL